MPWSRGSSLAKSVTPSAPFVGQVVSSMDVDHIMQRKIHSDLNEMARGFQNSPKGKEVFEQDRGTPFRNQPADVPQFSRQEEREEEKTEESCGLQWSPPEKGPSVNQSDNDPLVSTTEFHNDGSIPRTTFGRRLRRHSFHNPKATRSESQSSLSQAISCTPSPSYSSKSATPENFVHCRTFYPYAPYAQGKARDTDAEHLHSPHTFGMPTPSRSSSRSRGETHFSFKRTIPPPLPPLDHPVFREKVDEFGVLSTKQLFFPVPEKVTRHAHSLPSIAQATKATNSTSKSKSRKRSQSSTGEDQNKRKVRHSRTSSKTSIVSSRRSSAEYSAKQASSLGHNGCWEVDVSKAIISLSVQEPVAISGSAPGMIAFPGQTCGDNVGVPQCSLSCCRHCLFLTFNPFYFFNHYLFRIHRVSGLLVWVHRFSSRVSFAPNLWQLRCDFTDSIE